MNQPLLADAELAPSHQIRQFQQFRWGLILTEYAASVLALSMSYPVNSWPLMLLLLTLHGCSNLALPIWPGGQRYPERVFIIGILLDLLILTMLLALSGGASNGLIALLLLPVAVCAVLLPPLLAYLTALLAVVCYALLLHLSNVQTATDHSMHQQMNHSLNQASTGFNQHMLQMGWAFALSALLIAWFISAQAKLIRQKSQQLNDLQQQQSRQEQMLAVATYAANAAHNLATPLQNITLLSDELLSDELKQQPAELPLELLKDLQTEVAKCQHIVQQLRSSAQQLRSHKSPAQPVLDISAQALQLWLVSRPDISLSLQRQSDDSSCQLQDALAWSAALFNILDNAADASIANAKPELVVELELRQGRFNMKLRDFGVGLTPQQLAELGLQPQPGTKGLGLGQFLANASIERLGGQISRQNLPEGGTLTEVSFQAT
ncbi:MAG: HAMP domain-containing histidine kinase [Gammaproteobacteria bacterium]|jgi:two-component system, sensor histidine kinase RegB|nr:HAMP domain-containing histidine kinase [Gammaproteobacteria bacterium]MBU2180410.1 HAMP domain-containing histidine kinase [Gammaproteobacteria bacterium]MBU2225193.1 HAMP domain-containing histidine kinase [Gammaproteobacteria bacterium]MBU2280460.1 HAMP domain-containing histidine kinase [Gammaproteobacteria bacterium]